MPVLFGKRFDFGGIARSWSCWYRPGSNGAFAMPYPSSFGFFSSGKYASNGPKVQLFSSQHLQWIVPRSASVSLTFY